MRRVGPRTRRVDVPGGSRDSVERARVAECNCNGASVCTVELCYGAYPVNEITTCVMSISDIRW
eukprot:357531-Pyramimonas_sp.AAC.1